MARKPGTSSSASAASSTSASVGTASRTCSGAANAAIEAWAKEHKVDSLKLNDKFLDAEGKLSRELCGDLCHPTEKGYRIWAEGLKPFLPAGE